MNEHDVERRVLNAFAEGERQGRGYGAAAERARIVAWLRERSAVLAAPDDWTPGKWTTVEGLRTAATLIEEGKAPDGEDVA